MPIVCDVACDVSVATAFAKVDALDGDVEVLVFNAAPPFPPGTTFRNLPKYVCVCVCVCVWGC